MASETNEKYGDWIHERNLGSGGFGIIQFWKNCRTGQKMAIKKCKDPASLSDRQKQRWLNEVEIINHINHPNIISNVRIPKELVCIQSIVPVLCMEFCSRGDLRKFLNNPKNAFGIEQFKALQIMSDVASGVEFLHKHKITHRDLKPENIVIKERNGELTYKLIDLGYAKELGQDSLYASLVGTLHYVAPELFWNKKYSCSVDYWSLGILFYEVLTGTRPFLPHMKRTVTWMSAVKSKKYEQICAHEIGEKIYFFPDIADPTDLSGMIKEKIVEWFRVALQWDPKKRGRSENSDEIIIFDLLKMILSKKELHVFVVSQYQIISFPADEKSTLKDLQRWIQEKTEIPIHEQTVTAFECRVLNDKEPLLSQIQNQSEVPHVIVFKAGNLHVKKLPNQSLLRPVARVLENPKGEIDYCERIQFIKAVMFYINQEIRFSKWYQIALSIKIDLLYQRSAELDGNLKSEIKGLSCLKSEVEEFIQAENELTELQQMEFKNLVTKIEEKPLNTTVQMTKKFESLQPAKDELIKFAEVNWINDFSTLFDKVAQTFMDEDHTVLKARVESIIKLFFRFLELRSVNIEKNQDIIETTQKILFLEEELSKLEQFLNSANVLKSSYKSEFENLKENLRSNSSCASKSETGPRQFSVFNSASSSLSTNLQNVSLNESDDLIRDSLVIRYMMTNMVSKLEEDMPMLLDMDL